MSLSIEFHGQPRGRCGSTLSKARRAQAGSATLQASVPRRAQVMLLRLLLWAGPLCSTGTRASCAFWRRNGTPQRPTLQLPRAWLNQSSKCLRGGLNEMRSRCFGPEAERRDFWPTQIDRHRFSPSPKISVRRPLVTPLTQHLSSSLPSNPVATVSQLNKLSIMHGDPPTHRMLRALRSSSSSSSRGGRWSRW